MGNLMTREQKYKLCLAVSPFKGTSDFANKKRITTQSIYISLKEPDKCPRVSVILNGFFREYIPVLKKEVGDL